MWVVGLLTILFLRLGAPGLGIMAGILELLLFGYEGVRSLVLHGITYAELDGSVMTMF